MNADDIIHNEYGHSPNFMTPDVIRCGMIGRSYAYELSTGSGIEPGTILYGVSVVRVVNRVTRETERALDLSAVFRSQEAAEQHIQHLRERLS